MNDCWWISLLNKYAVKILLCRYSWKAPCPCTVDNFSKSWVQDSRGHHRHMQHNQRLREFHWYRSLGWGTCSRLAKPLDDVEIDFLNIFLCFSTSNLLSTPENLIPTTSEFDQLCISWLIVIFVITGLALHTWHWRIQKYFSINDLMCIYLSPTRWNKSEKLLTSWSSAPEYFMSTDNVGDI